MFARKVHLHLKPTSVPEFTRTIEKEVIPLLRKQKGFQDEITFVATDGLEVVEISLWDEKEDVDAYNRRAYPAVSKALEKLAEGTLEVQTYEVLNSTFHTIAARMAV